MEIFRENFFRNKNIRHRRIHGGNSTTNHCRRENLITVIFNDSKEKESFRSNHGTAIRKYGSNISSSTSYLESHELVYSLHDIVTGMANIIKLGMCAVQKDQKIFKIDPPVIHMLLVMIVK